MNGSRLNTALYLLLVFGSGTLVGVVSMRLYDAKTVTANASPAPRTMNEFRTQFLADFKTKVGISDAQATQVSQVLDDTKKKFDDLRSQEKPLRDKIQQEQVEGLRAVLTEAQRPAYDNWRAEREKARQQRRKNK